MSTVFVGGSRHITRLPEEAKQRLQNIIAQDMDVVVGDANGADKAAQKLLHDAGYTRVTVYCSGDRPRNNLGAWPVQSVSAPSGAKGFEFFAAKDRAMAARADFGLMVWDAESPGTLLNILRLIQLGKKAVLINVPAKQTLTLKQTADWEQLLGQCGPKVVAGIRERATSAERAFLSQPVSAQQPALFTKQDGQPSLQTPDQATAQINQALARHDLAAVIELLGGYARSQGMAAVAKQAGVSRESLYRSLSAGGNPEFATIIKVISSLGFRMSVSRSDAKSELQEPELQNS